MRISGSRVLVTGATGGIGQAIARAMAVRGAALLLSGRRTDVLDALAAELGGSTLAADLSDPGQIERLCQAAGQVDILVANAALPATGALDSFTEAQIDRALAVNLRAPIVLARAFTPAMAARGAGHVVFISSLAGKAASPSSSLYNATKFGLRGFASSLRAELMHSGVGVSTVFPGFIRDAGMFADSHVSLPLGVGTRTPQDVARAVCAAIEGNRGELDVAPLALRAGTILAGVAPELSLRVQRRLGGERVARDLAEGQREKR